MSRNRMRRFGTSLGGRRPGGHRRRGQLGCVGWRRPRRPVSDAPDGSWRARRGRRHRQDRGYRHTVLLQGAHLLRHTTRHTKGDIVREPWTMADKLMVSIAAVATAFCVVMVSMSGTLGAGSLGDVSSFAVGALMAVVLAAIYFLPTIVAAIRGMPQIGPIVIINLFLGWTLVGWVVALAM